MSIPEQGWPLAAPWAVTSSGPATADGACDRAAGTRVVLLGTAGGPAVVTDERFGVSTAVVHGDDVYLVDLGHGSHMRLLAAGLGGDRPLGTSFSRVRGIFFTHLHSDHIAEWPAVYATATMNVIGRTGGPIEVFGPGGRGTLPRVYPEGRPEPEVFAPGDPTPGLTELTARLREALAVDFNDRTRDSGFPSPDALFRLHDLDISELWAVDPAGVPPRLSRPIEVWEDGEVHVTATLVDHRPTAPAFAFRFDTPEGSVVVSGDTCVSENLIDLARGVDVLVHEVIDPMFVERLAAELPAEKAAGLREHLLTSHTTIEQVGRDVAERAGARTLVLNHLVPASNDTSRWLNAQEGYAGQVIVGEDLMEIDVAGAGGAACSRA
jgi:ribonuclease BN (tRNA processing enzyme)